MAAREEYERLEAEHQAREEADRKEREEAERKARAEAERQAREDAERQARAEAERQAREDAERKEHERLEAEQRAREEADRRARAETEREEREHVEAERRAREDAAAREREDRERDARERDARNREAREREARETALRELSAAVAATNPALSGSPGDRTGLVQRDHAAAFASAADEREESGGQGSAGRAYPIYEPPAETQSWTPEIEPPPAIEIAPVAAATPAAGIRLEAGSSAIKVQDEPGAYGAGPARAESRHEPEEEMSAAEAYSPFGSQQEARGFPWKLIAAGLVLIAVTTGVIYVYLPSQRATPVVVTKPPVEEVKKAPPPAALAGTGSGTHLEVTSEPAGARVMVDGKFVGTAPVTVDAITAGRHVITLQSSGGTVKRTVRIEPGKTVTLDVPVFSGFAVLSAPIVLEVAEGGKALGTSDQQIMLGPGHHDLHLENKELNYSGTLGVDIEPGETARVAVDPRGRANINAVPWAEVFVDGDKLGETPLGNAAILLGVREIVFKNPQFPDRKIVTTIKSGEPATITVDFTKDKLE
jgi:hypothetical protein